MLVSIRMPTNMAAGYHLEFSLAMLKPFVSLLNLQTFANPLLLTHWVFRPEKNGVNHVMCFSEGIFMSRTLKNLKFKLLYFQNKARYRAENMQAAIFLTCILPDNIKTENSVYFLILLFL